MINSLNLITHVLLFFVIYHVLLVTSFPQAQHPADHPPLGLYNKSDEVEELTTENFNQNVYGSQRIWLVEFYNTWCGHCRRYAPVYKAVADYFKEGKDLFVIAAVDCANEINQPLCREFEIMAYPTLRYFHENFVQGPSNLGTEIHTTGQHIKDIQTIYEKLISEQSENRAQRLPKLSPYTYSNVSNVFNHSNSNAQYAFLILNNDSGFLAVKTALVFHRIPNISITYSLDSNSELINTLNVKEYPTLIMISHEDKKARIEDKLSKASNIINEIEKFLNNKGIITDQYVNPKVKLEILNPSIDANDTTNLDVVNMVKKMGDVVFQMDLENALRFSLRKEVGRVKSIDGERLSALRKYLQVLLKYFPLGRKGYDLLDSLNDLVINEPVKGTDISALMKNSEKKDEHVWSSPEGWLGCKGSSVGNRGYPCGMWTMFHYLTVNAAEQNIGKTVRDPKEVLMTMHGYIKNFFGCADCSKHFQKMAVDRKIEEVSSFNDAILWLWSAHNEVNQRLAGDETEDPEFPKQQFPTSNRCPECRFHNGTWNNHAVEKYLKHMYGSTNIRNTEPHVIQMALDNPISDSNGALNSIDSISGWMTLLSLYLGYIHTRQ